MEREEEIRLIAYQIWVEEGYPHGKDHEHWVIAEEIWESRMIPGKSEPVKKKTERKARKPRKKNAK